MKAKGPVKVWLKGLWTSLGFIGAGIAAKLVAEKVIKASFQMPWSFQVPVFASGTNLIWQIGLAVVAVPLVVGYVIKIVEKKVR